MPPIRPCSNATSAAMLLKFVQLTAAPGTPIPILDCLLPRLAVPFTTSRVYASQSILRQTSPRPIHTGIPQQKYTNKRSPHWRQTPLISRALSTTPQRQRTVPLHNPPTDSSTLEITPRAASRLATIAEKDRNPNLALRIQVESGGCHGFQYLMSLVTLPEDLQSSGSAAVGADKNAIRDDDAIFSFVDDSIAEGSPEEAKQKLGGAKIILDGPSLDLLKGSKVDFTQELIGSQFKIVDNPLATSSCGCGTSFDIKLG